MKQVYTLEEICQSLEEKHEVIGPAEEVSVSGPAAIDQASDLSIAFCSKKDANEARELIFSSKARVIICSRHHTFSSKDFKGKTLIMVENPRRSFIKIVKHFFTEKVQYGISKKAIIDRRAEIHPEVYIGPNTTVGKAVIGQGTIIHGNVCIYDGTKIGKNVIVHSGAVIGATGFGYEREENGELLSFPHIGGVTIEDNVEIGANTCIDQGTLDDTIIGKGTKIDNLCHIAHNVVIGKHCAIIALTLIGGSTTIGDYSWVSPCSCVRDGLKIGKNTILGMGTVVTKDVEDNSIVFGIPGKKIRDNPAHKYLMDQELGDLK